MSPSRIRSGLRRPCRTIARSLVSQQSIWCLRTISWCNRCKRQRWFECRSRKCSPALERSSPAPERSSEEPLRRSLAELLRRFSPAPVRSPPTLRRLPLALTRSRLALRQRWLTPLLRRLVACRPASCFAGPDFRSACLVSTSIFSIALQHCTNGKTRPWLRTNRGFGLFPAWRWCAGIEASRL
jgi:hypothetical protein